MVHLVVQCHHAEFGDVALGGESLHCRHSIAANEPPRTPRALALLLLSQRLNPPAHHQIPSDASSVTQRSDVLVRITWDVNGGKVNVVKHKSRQGD